MRVDDGASSQTEGEVRNAERRDWTKDDIAQLMQLWMDFGSITIIAQIMNRNYASIQTQASRRQLPKRPSNGRHRRRWTADDDAIIQAYIDSHPKINITELANNIDRSVDSCVQRICSHFGISIAGLVDRLEFPVRAEPVKSKTCPNCLRQFIPKNRFNYVCAPCRKTDLFQTDF